MSFFSFMTQPVIIAFTMVALISLLLSIKLYNIYRFTQTIDPLIFFFVLFLEFLNLISWLVIWGYDSIVCGLESCISTGWLFFHNAVAAMLQTLLWYFLVLHSLYVHFRLSKTQQRVILVPFAYVIVHMYLRWLIPAIRYNTLAQITIITINLILPVLSEGIIILSYVLLKPRLKTKRTRRTRILFIVTNALILISNFDILGIQGIYVVLIGFIILGTISIIYPQTFFISTAQIMSATELYRKIERNKSDEAETSHSDLIDYISNLKENGIIS